MIDMAPETAKKLAIELSGYGYNIPKPVSREWLTKAYLNGMIPKTELVDGASYIGCCRNAYIAQWHADKEEFWHLRRKFDRIYAEAILHPEDDNGFDLFVPVLRIL